MKFIEKAKKVLEFNKIVDILCFHAPFEGVAEKIRNLLPSNDIYVIKKLQAQTNEAYYCIVERAYPPFGRPKNITDSVGRADKGSVLNTVELLNIASLLRSVSSMKKYWKIDQRFPVLNEMFGMFSENAFLEKAISKAIIAEELISDDASDKLFSIRREIRRCESEIRDSLSKYTAGGYTKYLQEAIITLKNGRYVVPVKSEFKNQIKGLVHDTSASGGTIFIEPMDVLEKNNKLRELLGNEKNEIERILAELSANVADFKDNILLNYELLIDIGVIFVKAQYAINTKAIQPTINENNQNIKLKNARHPLISDETVVPINVEFGYMEKSLIITGPNTGGKTVTLKTIGLLILMMQAGLFVPCDDGTSIPCFSGVFPDIGDEQNIEQSLSTFSSHMTNIIAILDLCDENSLVLFDELGAGTDPVEGAALAISIIEYVNKKNALLASTTHYSELKIYALENDNVLNASCEFDVVTLKPTYRLITGLPGKSNAFAIAKRLGIPPEIIDSAKLIMSDEKIKFEDILSKLEKSESVLSREREEVSKLKAETEILLQKSKDDLKREREKALSEIKISQDKAAHIIAAAKASADFIYNELNEIKKKKDKENFTAELEKSRKAIRDSIKSTDISVPDIETDDKDYIPPRQYQVGDTVYISSLKFNGTITGIFGEYAQISAGNMTTKLPLRDLRLVLDKPAKKIVKSGYKMADNVAVKHEIDLRGLNGDEAWFMVDSFIDSALLAGFETVTLIHGKGTGALRNALWRYIKEDKRIKEYRFGRYGEGELGVTVCTLRK